MEEEQEDVNLMNDFINQQKTSYQNNFQLEFEDFVNYKHDSSDQEYEEEIFNENEDQLQLDKIKDLPTSLDQIMFTPEEQDVIDSCSDPDLKRMLILNRSKNMQLMKLQKKIQGFLLECDTEIEENLSVLKNTPAKSAYQQTYLWKLTAPYFKDKKFYPAPRNEDAIRKRAENELGVYDFASCPKWTPIEFDRLTNAVKCNYNINRQKSVVSKINSLKMKMDDDEDKSMMEELSSLNEELEELKSDENVPPLNSNEHIDWYKVAETFLKNKHTASECKSVWHMLVHPDINKSEWSDDENQRLEAIAKKHRYQNWDIIALELDTKRTGFTACLHYFSKLCDKFKKSKFTQEEDSYLLEVVDIYKMGNFIPWNKVVCHFNKRSRHQLYHRYTYFLSQNHVKRGKFSEAEDILLIILVNKFGRNFKKCSEYMPHRSQVQLKSRYNSNLQRPIKKGTFTSEDDQIIYDYAKKHGEKHWTGLTTILNRCNAQIRQRYRLIKSYLKDNPDAKVAEIPKRRHRFDGCTEDQHNFLNYIADQYKDVSYVPTLAMIEECLQIELATRTSTTFTQNKNGALLECDEKVKNIDEMLTDFFKNSVIKKPSRMITETNLSEAAENAEELLKLLQASLEIPTDLECNVHLDNIDLEILETLSKKNVPRESEITHLCPPNISTLVGLRSLIIKHKEYKTQLKDKNFASTSKCDALQWCDETTQSNREILHHRDLFSKRFDSLFTWSAVLSLEKPNHEVSQPESNGTSGKTPHKRSTAQSYPVAKKRKVSVSALTSLTQNPQLKLVDKSVVEKLIRTNNINVIRIESVTGADGVVKSVFRTGQETLSAVNDVSCSPVDVANVVTTNDLDDVQALDSILKRMKSETNNDSDGSNNEYEGVEDDVQLLNEALKCERIRVKHDPD